MHRKYLNIFSVGAWKSSGICSRLHTARRFIPATKIMMKAGTYPDIVGVILWPFDHERYTRGGVSSMRTVLCNAGQIQNALGRAGRLKPGWTVTIRPRPSESGAEITGVVRSSAVLSFPEALSFLLVVQKALADSGARLP